WCGGTGRVEDERPLLQPGDQPVEGGDVDAPGCRSEPLQDPRLVPLGLETADHPRAGIRHCLVVEVDRVLGREQQPDT
ncbi:hypothetical protein DF186_24865, partial [Enterococcus hirae]